MEDEDRLKLGLPPWKDVEKIVNASQPKPDQTAEVLRRMEQRYSALEKEMNDLKRTNEEFLKKAKRYQTEKPQQTKELDIDRMRRERDVHYSLGEAYPSKGHFLKDDELVYRKSHEIDGRVNEFQKAYSLAYEISMRTGHPDDVNKAKRCQESLESAKKLLDEVIETEDRHERLRPFEEENPVFCWAVNGIMKALSK